jgi:glycerol kinase
MEKYVMSVVQGSTNSRCLIFDKNSKIVGASKKVIEKIFLKQDWVEYDPMEIMNLQLNVMQEALSSSGIDINSIESVGITNQRETTIIWNKNTGIPVYNAISWECRRTKDYCFNLKNKGLGELIKKKTGLLIDTFFSATKIKWILDNVGGAKIEAEKGNLIFGTIDSWIIWNLTMGRKHLTDYSNASRTMLFNIHSLNWDEEILKEFDIPKNILPKVMATGDDFGFIDKSLFGKEIPISGVAGNQQASMFGQTCFEIGSVKATYNTSAFILMNTGKKVFDSKNGLLTSIAWGINNKVEYILEGSVLIAGDSINWLKDNLKIIDNVKMAEVYAKSVKDSNGVYVVPAFYGLGAPYWNNNARGSVFGLTMGTSKEHLIRATLESIVYQIYDILEAIREDSKLDITEFKVDGEGCLNDFLMQFQSDILNIPVLRPEFVDTIARGIAYFAGLTVGFWENKSEIIKNYDVEKIYNPKMNKSNQVKIINKWHKAVERSLNWEETD